MHPPLHVVLPADYCLLIFFSGLAALTLKQAYVVIKHKINKRKSLSKVLRKKGE
jgi:hypothetical protein